MKALWRVGQQPEVVNRASLPSERLLEEMLVTNLRILSPDWMLIGHQIPTGTGFIDILAVARDGAMVVVELKKAKASREVVAQTLDYVSWVASLDPDTISEIFSVRQKKGIDEAFSQQFGSQLDLEQLNDRQIGVIVASTPDATTERIVRYLADSGVALNLNTFDVFQDGEQQYLSPNWAVDLAVTQVNAPSRDEKGPWNGHFYGSFGEEEGVRHWSDARVHGFFSAGGGAWYSRSLDLLGIDDLIWVQSPSHGYVGVGRVTSRPQPFDEFITSVGGQEVRLADLSLRGSYTHLPSPDDDTNEYCVGIRWLHTEDLDNAVRQPGFFGNQNSVCRPRVAKWSHTVAALKSRWKVEVE